MGWDLFLDLVGICIGLLCTDVRVFVCCLLSTKTGYIFYIHTCRHNTYIFSISVNTM